MPGARHNPVRVSECRPLRVPWAQCLLVVASCATVAGCGAASDAAPDYFEAPPDSLKTPPKPAYLFSSEVAKLDIRPAT